MGRADPDRTRPEIPVGVLFSTSGSYAALGREALDGALMAVAEIEANPTFPFRLRAEAADPCGRADLYAPMAEAQLRQARCRHIVGTITSWSRKDLLPVVERHGGLLWYAFPYEGYECSDHVVYLGACPNQHIVPLLDYVLPRFGTRPFLVGAHYVWGWEMNRIARELVEAAGGAAAGERCLPLGSTDVDGLIAEIRHARPDFVLSNLLGPSLYAFLAAYAALGARDPDFAPKRRPVVSSNLADIDIAEVGAVAAGHITTSIYFDALADADNAAFKQRVAQRHGSRRRLSSCFASAYSAVRIFAEALRDAGTEEPRAVLDAATRRSFATPMGPLCIDARTRHTWHRPHLGEVDGDGRFVVLDSAAAPVAPDPYLLGHAHLQARRVPRPLRVVT